MICVVSRKDMCEMVKIRQVGYSSNRNCVSNEINLLKVERTTNMHNSNI